MGEIWTVIDHSGGDASKVTLQMLTAGRMLAEKMGHEPAGVFVGTGWSAAKDRVAAYGLSKAYVAEHEDFDTYLIQPAIDTIAGLAKEKQPEAILFASVPYGKDLASGIAAKLEAGILADVTDIEPEGDRLVCRMDVFGGLTITRCQVAGSPQIICVKPNAFVAEESSAELAEEAVEVKISDDAKAAKVVDRVSEEEGGRPGVEEAAIIVSGGRGLGGPEHFSVVEELADVLGAAVGASRAAVDAGWYPHQHQVGQTGKTVSPQLYLAVGISGAIQHRAGMQTSKTIVAINKDPEAPIFNLCDFGVVGDLFDVVPKLTEELKKRKGS